MCSPYSVCRRGELQCSSQGCEGNPGLWRPVPVSPGLGDFGMWSLHHKARTVLDIVPCPAPTPSLVFPIGHDPTLLLPAHWAFWVETFLRSAQTLCPSRPSASDWMVRVVTLWALPAPKCPSPCLQDYCPGGALASEHVRPPSTLGHSAGFGAVPAPPLLGPGDRKGLGRRSCPLHCASQPAAALPRPWSLQR